MINKGYTNISNRALDALATMNVNGVQGRIILQILRHTEGIGKRSNEISTSFLADAIGSKKQYISKELSRLIDMKIIKQVTPNRGWRPRELAFNPNVEEWMEDAKGGSN